MPHKVEQHEHVILSGVNIKSNSYNSQKILIGLLIIG